MVQEGFRPDRIIGVTDVFRLAAARVCTVKEIGCRDWCAGRDPDGGLSGVTPSIAVVTVTLNAEEDLMRHLESLRRQTDPDFRYIVIDGASTDRTWNIIQGATDVVTYAVSESDRGFYDALNKAVCIVQQQSDYYVVVGADDILYPNAIADYKAAVLQSNADVVVAGVRAGGVVRRGFHPGRAWRGHAAMITSHSVGMLFRARLHQHFGEYSWRYPLLADGYFIKRVCTADSVKTVAADFIAGEFSLGGLSNRNLLRALCEAWQVQVDTGENRLLQYLLFQYRLLKLFPRIAFGGRRSSVDP